MKRARRQGTTKAYVALVPLLLLLAACGSSKPTASSTGSTTSSSSSVPTTAASGASTSSTLSSSSVTVPPSSTLPTNGGGSGTATTAASGGGGGGGGNGATTTTAKPATTTTSTATQKTFAITIENFAFSPSDLKIPVGATVVVTNKDSATHTWTADDGTFDSGDLAQGKSFSFTFKKAGSFPYKCTLHTFMTGTVDVS